MKKEVFVCPMCEGSKIIALPTGSSGGFYDEGCPLCEGRGFVVYKEKKAR